MSATDPLSPERLAEIEKSLDRTRGAAHVNSIQWIFRDVPDLLAEVRRLRAENERLSAIIPTLNKFNPEKHMVCKKPPHTCLRCRQPTVVLAEWEGDGFKDGFKWTCKNCGEVTYS